MGCGLLTDSLGQQGFYVLRTSVPEGIFYGNMVAVAQTGLDIPVAVRRIRLQELQNFP